MFDAVSGGLIRYWPSRCRESSHDEASRGHPISLVVAYRYITTIQSQCKYICDYCELRPLYFVPYISLLSTNENAAIEERVVLPSANHSMCVGPAINRDSSAN